MNRAEVTVGVMEAQSDFQTAMQCTPSTCICSLSACSRTSRAERVQRRQRAVAIDGAIGRI